MRLWECATFWRKSATIQRQWIRNDLTFDESRVATVVLRLLQSLGLVVRQSV